MEAEEFYKTRRYRNTLHESIIPYLRHKLDGNGLGELLISLCRAKESRVDGLFPGPYYTIILGALMMRAGAEISQDNIQHLWDLMTQITKYRVWKLPAFPRDFQGLWSPGRAQFIVALIFYRAGVARSFADER